MPTKLRLLLQYNPSQILYSTYSACLYVTYLLLAACCLLFAICYLPLGGGLRTAQVSHQANASVFSALHLWQYQIPELVFIEGTVGEHTVGEHTVGEHSGGVMGTGWN